ncbi:hypothetical protein NC652_012377 [Populus alba x Populus x berolinensis]|nr:hypothetical protein NC652_012377 [Populus alba x Populus x berolinensis]
MAEKAFSNQKKEETRRGENEKAKQYLLYADAIRIPRTASTLLLLFNLQHLSWISLPSRWL